MAEFGILLIGGVRSHQPSHAAVFEANPRCRIVAVANEKDLTGTPLELNQQLAKGLGVPYIPDLDDALARDDVDVVSSTPYVERRGTVVVKCLDAGKHVYLDKPLAGTVQDADAIAAAAVRAGPRAKTQMFSMNQAHWVQAARKALDDGAVGELKAIHAENIFSKGHAGSIQDDTVRQEMEQPGRYTFVEAKREAFDVGVYSLAFIHMMTDFQVESVYGITGNYFFAEHAGVGVEDFGALALTMKGGLSATTAGGRFGWMSHPMSGPQSITLIGTERTLFFDAYRPRVEIYNDEPDFVAPPSDPIDPMGMWEARMSRYESMPKRRWVRFNEDQNPMEDDVAHFLDCIEDDREPELNAVAAASIVEVILAGYASAARDEPVGLPLPRN